MIPNEAKIGRFLLTSNRKDNIVKGGKYGWNLKIDGCTEYDLIDISAFIRKLNSGS